MEISIVIEEEHPTWMTPITDFISKGTLPQEQKDARRLDGYGAQRRDSNFETVSYIGVHSYNHGLGTSYLFRKNTYSEKSKLDLAACTQDHGPL